MKKTRYTGRVYGVLLSSTYDDDPIPTSMQANSLADVLRISLPVPHDKVIMVRDPGETEWKTHALRLQHLSLVQVLRELRSTGRVVGRAM